MTSHSGTHRELLDVLIERVNEIRETYTVHKNVKLSRDQAAVIDASGEPDSQWIREAVQRRIDSGE